MIRDQQEADMLRLMKHARKVISTTLVCPKYTTDSLSCKHNLRSDLLQKYKITVKEFQD